MGSHGDNAITRRLKAPRLALLLGLLWALTAPAAGAASLQIQGGSKYLKVDQAFQPSATWNDGKVVVHWQIADGYYLYRHAFKFQPATDGLRLGPTAIPRGHVKTDDFFGKVETYRGAVAVPVPVTARPPGGGALKIKVTYQGCADAGLCYPPQTRTLAFTPTAAAAAPASNDTRAAVAGNAADSSDNKTVPEQDRLAGLLAHGAFGWIVLSFFGLGLLLAFTPCILPMIPILSALLVGRGGDTGAARGFGLSLAYVLAMAAGYTLAGVLAGLFGANLQAALQSPWVLVPFALVFVLLALAMFDAYQLQLPPAWQSRLDALGRRSGGGPLGAAAMGFVAALIVGPCVAPPLAGALLYIGSTGNAWLGGAALFALGLGMGAPLLVFGTVGGGVLPRAGAWMDAVKTFFGVVLLAVALWLLTRLLPAPLMLALWAILLGGYGVWLGALEPLAGAGAGARLAKAAGVLALAYAVILLVGAGRGADNPLRPLAPAAGSGTAAVQPAKTVFNRVRGPAALDQALAVAQRQHQPAVVDFYADWCVECVQMQHGVFSKPRVRSALAKVAAIQVDITPYNAADRKLLRQRGVFGPPTMLFFDADGHELRDQRVVGAVDIDGLLSRLHTVSAL